MKSNNINNREYFSAQPVFSLFNSHKNIFSPINHSEDRHEFDNFMNRIKDKTREDTKKCNKCLRAKLLEPKCQTKKWKKDENIL